MTPFENCAPQSCCESSRSRERRPSSLSQVKLPSRWSRPSIRLCPPVRLPRSRGLSPRLVIPVGGGRGGPGAGLNLRPWPKGDFTKLGPVESQDRSRIKKISGANLHRNWVMIPHVCNHDNADITELEAFRVQLNKENEK